MSTVADCEAVQAAWFAARARALDGEVWSDGPLRWTFGPDGQNVLFPTTLAVPELERGLARARARELCIVGAWLGLEVDAAPLAAAGFERGWSPWWMTAALAELELRPDPRIELLSREDSRLVRELPGRVWCAVARVTPDRQSIGRAWALLHGDFVGVFNMDVWPAYQRRGLGTALLHRVLAAARGAGATHAVLNATPDGEKLYRHNGFTRIGEGMTWWHHMGA